MTWLLGVATLAHRGNCFAAFVLFYSFCTQGQLSCSPCTRGQLFCNVYTGLRLLHAGATMQGYKLVKCSVDTVRLQERLSVYIRFTCHVLYARDLHETYIYINTALE